MCARRKSETTGRAALGLAAIVAFSRVAAAESESVRIEYVAPARCPDATAFMRSLEARTTRFRQAGPDEQTRRFFVRVTEVGSSYAGSLEISSPDGSTSVRSVDAAVCEEVSEALALMTALAIDPDALTSGTKAAPKSPIEPAPEPATAAAPKPSPRLVADVAGRPPPSAQSASRPWRWSAGVLGHTTFEISPAPGYGGDLFVEAEAPVGSALGPAARIGIFLNQSDLQLPTGAAARFQWATLSVEGCPVRLGLAALRTTVYPCVASRLGLLRSEGRRISQPERTDSVWSDVGPVVRLRLSATARLLLEADTGLMLPLHRPTFEILDMGSPTTAHTVPRLGGWVGVGGGYRFR
jgi:hypothetical protein